MDTKSDAEKRFDEFEVKFRELIVGAMQQLNVLGAITSGFRSCEGDERKLALTALDFLIEQAPTRHKKAQVTCMKEAVERFWFEKDNNLLPAPTDPSPTIMH